MRSNICGLKNIMNHLTFDNLSSTFGFRKKTKIFSMEKILSSFAFPISIITILFSFHFAVAQETEYKEKQLQLIKQNATKMDEATLRAKMRADGLFDPVIDKLIAQRKLWEKQGRNVNWSNAVNSRNAQTPVVNAPCSGLGVESGWGAWNWQQGSNNGSNPPVWSG